MATRRGHLEAIVIGTVLVHVVLITGLDIAGTWARHHPPEPPPEEIELDDTPPPPPPPEAPKPPPPPEPQKAPEPAPPQVATPVHHAVSHEVAHATPATPTPPQDQTPPPETPPEPGPPGGGDEPYRLPEGPTGGVAIPVAHGTGGGGSGHGTGGGSGAGTGSGAGAPPAPTSIASIKTPARPRGDYSYFKDYPADARRAGIEGKIRVRLIVDAKGAVKARTLLNKLGYGLDELALARAGEIEFDPALDERDQPVSSVVVWTFSFTLPK